MRALHSLIPDELTVKCPGRRWGLVVGGPWGCHDLGGMFLSLSPPLVLCFLVSVDEPIFPIRPFHPILSALQSGNHGLNPRETLNQRNHYSLHAMFQSSSSRSATVSPPP